MKLKVPFLIGGAVAACAGLSLAGAPATVPEPAPVVAATVVDAPAPEPTTRERRERFKARVQAMLDAGDGPRLTDARPQRRASSSTAPRRAAAPAVAPAATTAPTPRSVPVASGLPTIDLPETPSRTMAAALVRPTEAIDCLTQAIYYEARSESEDGQAAVAEVILNRARSGRYPRDVCDVVYQRNARTCQFSYTCDGSIGRTRINAQAWARAERIAREVHAGRAQAVLPSRSVNYHANYVAPGWGRRLERVRQIGAHIFYGSPLQGGTPGASEDMAGTPQPTRQLTFVRLDALDRAYDLFRSSADAAPTAAPAAQ